MLTIDLFNKRIRCSHCGKESNARIGIQECYKCFEHYCDTDECERAHAKTCERKPAPGMRLAHDRLWDEPELPVVFERGRFDADEQGPAV